MGPAVSAAVVAVVAALVAAGRRSDSAGIVASAAAAGPLWSRSSAAAGPVHVVVDPPTTGPPPPCDDGLPLAQIQGRQPVAAVVASKRTFVPPPSFDRRWNGRAASTAESGPMGAPIGGEGIGKRRRKIVVAFVVAVAVDDVGCDGGEPSASGPQMVDDSAAVDAGLEAWLVAAVVVGRMADNP